MNKIHYLYILSTLILSILILCFYNLISPYEALDLLIQSCVFIAILFYVYQTYQIAKETSRHNQILTTPYITAQLMEHSQLDHIFLNITNHTMIHTNIRIKLVYEKKDNIKNGNLKITTPIKVGAYNGIKIWNIPAKQNFIGHTYLDHLKSIKLQQNEVVILNIEIEVSEFTKNDFHKNPLVQYYITKQTVNWIPSPILIE